jgi:polysaccharide export outer membrane protein
MKNMHRQVKKIIHNITGGYFIRRRTSFFPGIAVSGFLSPSVKALLTALIPILIFGAPIGQTQAQVPAGQGQPAVAENSDQYVIGPEDGLAIHVWKEEALSQSVVVRTDGMISLPLIDEVRAAGLTPLQLKGLLTQKLKAFVEDPVVTVMVREARSFKVYISGQVAKPGMIPLITETNILQLIAQAGGFTEWANQKKILLIRKEGGQETRMTINYKKIVSGEAPNVWLKTGDTIIVPE